MTDSITRKSFLDSFLIVIGYAALFYLFQFFLHRIGAISTAPSEDNIIFWDGGWYRGIAEEGYKLHSPNTGFFILFPLIWKYSLLGVWGISLLNITFLAAGLSLLNNVCNLTTRQKLAWLSFPSVFYCYIPYTESLFFLLCALCFCGIVKNKKWLIWVSLFLIGLCRSTSIFLIPAFFMMCLLTEKRENFLKRFLLFSRDFAAPLGLGLFAFFLFQFKQTGDWFIYFKTQTNYFSHHFALPTFPLSGHEAGRRTWLGALGVWLDTLALVYLAIISLQWVLKGKVQQNKLFVLSLCYLSVTLIQTLFFNPHVEHASSTSTVGIHRYTFATIFALMALYNLTTKSLKTRDYILFVLFTNCIWLAFGSYEHIQTLLFFNGITLYLLLYTQILKKNWASSVLFALNFMLQILLFQDFINVVYTD